MRTKEIIYKIKSHPIFQEIDKLKKMDYESFKKKYEGKQVKPYYNYEDYTTGLYNWQIDQLTKQLPEIHISIPFKYGQWGNVSASIKIELNQYDRKNASVTTNIYFNFTDIRPNILWDAKIKLPENCTITETLLKSLLKPYLFEDGIIALLQAKRNTDKQQAIWHYKNLNNTNGPINETQIYKSIKKRFNIDSYLSIEDTIKFVNQSGALKTLTKLQKLDISFMYDFDGDIDEIETELYSQIEDNTIYV